MKNYIQVNNFRKYISTPEIELNDLNFFVGTNSSGKSTLVKAYLLITTFIKSDKLFEIDFSSPEYKDLNIQEFKRQICKFSANENNIRIELGLDDFIFKLELILHTRSNYAKVLEYTLKDNLNDVIYEYKYVKGRTTSEIDYFDRKEQKTIWKEELNEETFQVVLTNNQKYKDNVLDLIEKSILNCNNDTKLKYLNDDLRLIENTTDFEDIILELNTDYLSLDSFKKFAQELLRDKKIPPIPFASRGKKNNSPHKIMRQYRIVNFNDRNVNKLQERKIKGFVDMDNWDKPLPNGMELSIKLFDLFKKIDSFKTIFLPLTFRKYTNLSSIVDKSNDLAQLVHQYYNKEDRDETKSDEFIKYWLGKEQFNIGDDFEINFYGGEAYEILIHENGIKIPLVDKGTGNIQIFKILLLVATYSNCTIILEEPELNLHPSLQSKLADFIVAVNTEKGKQKFIVETHSEYLIRRLQVLVAKGEVKDSDLAITYFPSEYNQQPYQLNIKADGTLDKNFGTGFFDEASNHTLELIKFKRLSHN